MKKSELKEVMLGIEPTSHYWFDLGQFMGEKNTKFVMVNPHHVHKTKELDDNSPSKNDRKDPRVIVGLVKEEVYTHIDAKGGLLILKKAAIPEKIVNLGVEGIIKIWKNAKLRGNGYKKAMKIFNAATNSIGLKTGFTEAQMEIQDLIEDYELQTKRLERVNDLIKELC